MQVMSVDKGRIRNVTLSKRVKLMTATNSLGWQVEQYNPVTGWSKVPDLPIVPQKGIAELMLEERTKKALEQSKDFDDQPLLRVYEALIFPVN